MSVFELNEALSTQIYILDRARHWCPKKFKKKSKE